MGERRGTSAAELHRELTKGDGLLSWKGPASLSRSLGKGNERGINMSVDPQELGGGKTIQSFSGAAKRAAKAPYSDALNKANNTVGGALASITRLLQPFHLEEMSPLLQMAFGVNA